MNGKGMARTRAWTCEGCAWNSLARADYCGMCGTGRRFESGNLVSTNKRGAHRQPKRILYGFKTGDELIVSIRGSVQLLTFEHYSTDIFRGGHVLLCHDSSPGRIVVYIQHPDVDVRLASEPKRKRNARLYLLESAQQVLPVGTTSVDVELVGAA